MLPPSRTYYTPMSPRTKSWIKGMRRVQLVLRALELIGALGLFVLLILLTGMDMLAGWIMRVTVRLPGRECTQV